MPLQYLLNENLRGSLWRVIRRHNASGQLPLDTLRVGDSADLPLGSSDVEVLVWAERQGRILISRDRQTLAVHLASHLRSGRHSPGVLIPRQRAAFRDVLAFLIQVAYLSDAADWRDRIEYIP